MARDLRYGLDLRAGDAEGEEVACAHPVNGPLGDIEVLRGRGGDGREGEPLSESDSVCLIMSRWLSYIPTDDDVQQHELGQPPEATLVDPVYR
jgi:hypothetical protein